LKFFKGINYWQDRDVHCVYVFSSNVAAVFFVADFGGYDICPQSILYPFVPGAS
jgi:hypothetical protein